MRVELTLDMNAFPTPAGRTGPQQTSEETEKQPSIVNALLQAFNTLSGAASNGVRDSIAMSSRNY